MRNERAAPPANRPEWSRAARGPQGRFGLGGPGGPL